MNDPRGLRATVPAIAIAAALSTAIGVSGCGDSASGPVKLTGQLEADDAGQSPDLDDATSARVSLVEHGDLPEQDQIVAERTIHGVERLPTGYSLSVNRALLDDTHHYGLSAQLLDDDSDVIWQTEAPERVDVFTDNPSTVLHLTRYRVTPEGPFATYACSDGFRFELARDARGAIVHLGKRQISLHAAKGLTPEATRYVDAHNDEIVTEHGVTSIYFDGVSHHDCEVIDDAAKQNDSESDSDGSTG